MVSQDFAPADSFYEPAQDSLVLGLPPLLAVFLLILLVAAGLLGWWLGRRPRRAPGSAAAAIWKAVDDAIRATMTAHSSGLVDRAHDLRRVIQEKLGRTLALTAGFAALTALDDALADPAEDHASGHGSAHGGDHGEHGGHAPASGHDDDDADEAEPRLTQGIVIERASQVVIHQPPRRQAPNRPTPAPSPPPPSEAQRRDAIRKAVSDLNDHWRLKEARVAEIEAAHKELSAV